MQSVAEAGQLGSDQAESVGAHPKLKSARLP